LKWPNDLLAGPDESKLAGVLAEAEFAGDSPAAVVVGIGVNVAWPGPEGAGGTCLDDVRRQADPAAEAVDRRGLLEGLLSALAPRRALLDDAAGRRVLADEARRRCATVGRTVRVVLAGEAFTGRAVGIDDAGCLEVETPQGLRRVSAGDVVHVRPA
jgi:BirA family transcriptional regulator, biotin operon repressor / biotin---[acetyl-CoA-carboxylase] ligase